MKPVIRSFISSLAALLILCTASADAQNGKISGTITDDKTGETVIGASVIIEGTTIGAVTDLDGRYTISNVKSGTYKVNVSFIGFETRSFENVTVRSGETTIIDARLGENIEMLKGADIVAQKVTNTEGAVLMEVKQAEQVVNGISSQQISRSQDRTAGEVIRRVPGVTVMNNGFILIRGLNERYNTTLLNGTIAPSMESDKKAFAFDLIPSQMLDRIMVYKTGAPELPGEFGGGVVKIYTKNVSDEDAISVGYSTAYLSNTTFKDFYQAPKGGTDWLGKDDGTRSLPDAFPKNLFDVTDPAILTDLGRMLPNAWTAAVVQARPDQKFNMNISKNFKAGNVKVGNVTSVKYDFTSEAFHSSNYAYNAFDPELQQSDTIYSYNDGIYNEKVRLSLIHNWSFMLNSNTKLEFRNFFNQQGNNQAIVRDGVNIEEGNLVQSYAYRYEERTIYSGQLSGSHDMNADRSNLSWTLGYSYTHSAEPDFRRIRTAKDINDTTDTPYQVVIAPTASTLDAGRFYSDLNENTVTGAVDFEHNLKPRDEKNIPKLRLGVYSEYKSRDFFARWMSYKKARISQFDDELLTLPLSQIFSSGNINDSTGFKREEGTNPSDQYEATNTLMAGYVGTSWPLGKKWNVSGGVRVEYNRQTLTSSSYTGAAVEVDNPITSILPSINTSYNISEKSLLRFAYSMSVNRPEFRELAPFSYYDFTFNNILFGNSDLETPSIQNFDLRWELYPRMNEQISIAAFYKAFTNPIEMFFVPGTGSGGTRTFTFGNAESATSLGLEMELKKSFSGLFKKGFLSKMGVSVNLAWIESEVTLGDDAVGQSTSRPMMGQSPFIVNSGIFYLDADSRFQVNAMYNVIGKRLFAVGTFGSPDIYYMPRHMVDVTVSKGIGKNIVIKAGVQDLLAQDLLYIQDSDENGEINGSDDEVIRMRRGAYYTLGISVNL
jgi:outer membrane receptor for ferrienterochelin and colicin